MMSDVEHIPDSVKRYEANPDAFFDADEYYDIADYYESVIETDSAFSVLVKGISVYPDDLTLRLEMARLSIATGDLDKAEKLIHALKRDPSLKNKEDRLAINMLMVKLDVENGHISELEKDIAGIPEWVDGVGRDDAVSAISDMASSMYLSFFFKYAIETLNKGIKLFPDEISFYETLIECYMKEDANLKEALKVAEKAIDIDPYNAVLWFKLGYINRFDDNIQEAIKDFDYATSIDDNYYDAWKAMADCHGKNRNYEKAAECYIKAIDPKNDDINLLVCIGDMFNNCDKYAEARKYYKAALDIDDSKDDALFGMGMSFFLDIDSQPTNFEMAVFWIKRAINEADGNPLYWNILGECYFSTGNWALAIFAYQHSLNIKAAQADVMAKTGQSYYAVEDYENAVYFLHKARDLDPEITSVDLVLAAVYYNMKEFSKSKYYLMRAAERDVSLINVFLENNPDALDVAEAVRKLI